MTDDREVTADAQPSTIVQAVASMTSHAELGNPDAAAHNKLIQDAMVAAIEQAQAEGITDENIIRERILAARDAAIA